MKIEIHQRVIWALAMLCVAGCSPSPEVPAEDTGQKAVVKEQENPGRPVSLEQAYDAVKDAKGGVLPINGGKIEVSTLPLRPNDKVFDPLVGQQALVKGSIVVVTNSSETLTSDNLSFDVSVNPLAARTYELTVEDKQADMFALYQQLKQDPRFSQVELQLRYLSGHEPSEY